MKEELFLLFILLSGFISPFLSRIFRLPLPVGELIIGLILGSILGSHYEVPEIVKFLSYFGFLILMFLAGLEVDFNLLEKLPGKYLLMLSVYVFSIPFVSVLVSKFLGYGFTFGILISLISVGLLSAVLRGINKEKSSLVRYIFVIGALGEIMSLLLLSSLSSFSDGGLERTIYESFKFLIFFLFFFLLFAFVKILIWWFPEILKVLVYERDPSAVEIRLSFFLIFTFSVAVHIVGFESVLGAFLAGILISYFIRDKRELEEKVSSVGYGFFIPIFFIETGFSLNFKLLSFHDLIEVIFISLIILLVRLLTSPLLAFLNISLKESFTISVFISFPFTLLIAGIEISSNLNLIDVELSLKLFLSVILTSLFYPWLGKLLFR